jgi:hypothetical protein
MSNDANNLCVILEQQADVEGCVNHECLKSSEFRDGHYDVDHSARRSFPREPESF